MYFYNTETEKIESIEDIRKNYYAPFGSSPFQEYISACMTENGGALRPLRQHIMKLEDELKRTDELDDDERKARLNEIEYLRRLEK